MIKRMIIMLIVLAIVLGGVFGWKFYSGMQMQKMMMAGGIPAQTVSTIKATLEDWQPKLVAVGSLRAVNGTDLSAEVPGIVESINFTSGADITQDTVLVTLRAEDDIAKLHALEAAAKLASITLDRDQRQLKGHAVSQAVVDNDVANLDQAKALVEQQKAVVDKKIIYAPFSGQLGIRQVDPGQFLNAGTNIVTLQQIDPIYVDFNLPEQALVQIKVGQKTTVKTDAYNNTEFEGEVSAINSKIDTATRNVLVRATIKNPEHKLLPGMFAHVDIDIGAPVKQITLPQTAITYSPYGDTVYIVDGDAQKPTAKQVFITEGATRGDQVAILTGVKEGDPVVTAGQIKLRNGIPVTVNNEVQPANEPNPAPHE